MKKFSVPDATLHGTVEILSSAIALYAGTSTQQEKVDLQVFLIGIWVEAAESERQPKPILAAPTVWRGLPQEENLGVATCV